MKKISFIVTLVFFIASCKKDKVGNDCESLPASSNSIGNSYVLEGKQYQTIDFNPNNYNEFCGTRLNNGNNELFITNLQGSSITVITSNSFFGYPKWGRSGWILLNGNDWNVYVIKPNGDSLTQLTFTNDALYPTWNYRGDSVIYLNNQINKCLVFNTSTRQIDTINALQPNYAADWTAIDGIVIGVAYDYIYKYSISQNAVQEINNPYYINFYRSIQAIDSNRIAYCDDKGTYIINFNSTSYSQIIENCGAKDYGCLRYNPINQRLYFSKLSEKLISENTLNVQSRIVSTNLDGSDEQELALPE